MRRLLLFAALSAASLVAQPRRPNIVILFADDMGYHDAGFNGRKEWTTPHLDRLASQGTIFDRWYTGYPLCNPSRGALLTGRHGIHTGVRNNSVDLPKDETTIAEALKPLGYATALFGKWHSGKLPDGTFTHPLDQGFDETFGYLNAREAWEHFPKEFWRGRAKETVNGYSCDLIANEAVRFINEKKNTPFFLYLPFIEPHFWIEAPEENVAKFRGKFPEKDPSKTINANYAAMITRLDAAIGRIVKALDDAGLRDNTLIVFTSDNGATFEERNYGASAFHDSNAPFRGQKRSLEEGGIRMPSLVRWPGHVPAGKRSEALMQTTDLLPTLLTAAGGTPAANVDGKNMIDVWKGGPAAERTLLWEFNADGWSMYAAMRGDWKYLEIGPNRWLYNVRKDPQERRTYAQEEPEIFKSLQAEMKAWLATAKPN